MRCLLNNSRKFLVLITFVTVLVTLASCNTQKKAVLNEGFADAFGSVDVPVNDRFLSGGPEGAGELSQITVKGPEALEKFVEIQKKNPKAILIDGNRMLVSDWVQRSLSAIDMRTKVETVFVPAIDFVSDMVKDRSGNIVAGLFTGEQVVTIDRAGKVTRLAENLGKVSAVAVSPDGQVYAASFDRGIVYKLNKDITTEPEVVVDKLQNPSGLAFGSDGRLYVSQFSGSESVLRYDVRVLTKEVFAIGISQPAKMVFVGPRLYVGAAEAGRGVIWSVAPDGEADVLVAGEFDDPIAGPATDGRYLYVGSSAGRDQTIYRIVL